MRGGSSSPATATATRLPPQPLPPPPAAPPAPPAPKPDPNYRQTSNQRSLDMVVHETKVEPTVVRSTLDQYEESKLLHQSVKDAARGVADGADAKESQCWECGTHPAPGAKFRRCTGCMTSHYW